MLGSELVTPFQRGRGGPGGWLIVDEPELHLGGDILVPDLAGWRRERLPKYPNAAFITLAPDWICELETYELIAGRWTELGSFEGEGKIHAVPFDAIELELGVLWEDVEQTSEG